ncbi:uncharacterized protein [Palaemon carinicauda]|uniref:uncharacterized protein n=1 Tax=Palaemon carinicauda TaxID=392227 RepID=UPI0035B60711
MRLVLENGLLNLMAHLESFTATLVLTTKDQAECVGPFQILSCIGCFHVSSEKSTWEVSKTSCENLNSSLYVAKSEEKFHKLRLCLKQRSSSDDIYVGVKNRFWTGGRKVTEWASGQPNDPVPACGRMKYLWEYKLADWKCHEKYHYLCEKELTTAIADGCTGRNFYSSIAV